ncbi:MAG: VCBS repeat-containing protein [Lentisphaerae bacterium]|nr:VCBS repeat-containing protein [Lentisphaerota bacterium]
MKISERIRRVVLSGLAVLTLCSIGAQAGPLRDYNGDGKSDLALYYEAGGGWYVETTGQVAVAFGASLGGPGYTPVAGDFNGDGRSDFAVYRQSEGSWFIKTSTAATAEVRYFGWSEAYPVPADYDGDGMTDLGVYYPTLGLWYLLTSSNTFASYQFGWSETRPVPADYDGDGKADLAVYVPSNGMWYVFQSSDRQIRGQQFGWSAAEPVLGDFDGDGKDDFSVYDPAGGMWYIFSQRSQFYNVQIGWSDTVPAPADYDGDGVTDLAVYYPDQGRWYIVNMAGIAIAYPLTWGWSGAGPIPVFPETIAPTATSSGDFGDNDPNLYVALGDSITEGYGLSSYGDIFVSRLAALLGKSVANEGVGGEQSEGGLDRVSGVLSWYKPGYMIVLYGANDVFRSDNTAGIVANLRGIIDAAKNNNTVPLICTLTPVSGSHGFMTDGVLALNREIRILAQTENVTLVDFEAALGWNTSYLSSDGLHPNSAGHQVMANTLYDLLR